MEIRNFCDYLHEISLVNNTYSEVVIHVQCLPFRISFSSFMSCSLMTVDHRVNLITKTLNFTLYDSLINLIYLQTHSTRFLQILIRTSVKLGSIWIYASDDDQITI